jgi:hypothetical protein
MAWLLLLLQIKLPCTPDGLAAASALMVRDESISITITGGLSYHDGGVHCSFVLISRCSD